MSINWKHVSAFALVCAVAVALALVRPFALAFVLGAPWLLGIVWVVSRAGWQILWSPEDGAEEFPAQAHRLPSFGARS